MRTIATKLAMMIDRPRGHEIIRFKSMKRRYLHSVVPMYIPNNTLFNGRSIFNIDNIISLKTLT